MFAKFQQTSKKKSHTQNRQSQIGGLRHSRQDFQLTQEKVFTTLSHITTKGLKKLLKSSKSQDAYEYISYIARQYQLSPELLFKKLNAGYPDHLTLPELAKHVAYKKRFDLPLIPDALKLNTNMMSNFYFMLSQRVNQSKDDVRDRFNSELSSLSKLKADNDEVAFHSTFNLVAAKFNEGVKLPERAKMAQFDIEQLLKNARESIENVLENGDTFIAEVFGSETVAAAKENFGQILKQLEEWRLNPQMVKLLPSQNRIFTDSETRIVTLGLDFYTKQSDIEREFTLIHEASHAAEGVKTVDILYRQRLLFSLLTGAGALKNADSYRVAVAKVLAAKQKKQPKQKSLEKDALYLQKVVGYADWLLQKANDMLNYLENGYRGLDANVSSGAANLLQSTFPIMKPDFARILGVPKGAYTVRNKRAERRPNPFLATFVLTLRTIVSNIQHQLQQDYVGGQLTVARANGGYGKQYFDLKDATYFYTVSLNLDVKKLIKILYINQNSSLDEQSKDLLANIINHIHGDLFLAPPLFKIANEELEFVQSL